MDGFRRTRALEYRPGCLVSYVQLKKQARSFQFFFLSDEQLEWYTEFVSRKNTLLHFPPPAALFSHFPSLSQLPQACSILYINH